MKKFLPELIVFFAGMATMIFEVVGARVLGPYFGTSVFVWTSLIGGIMASLSLGYWLGGLASVRNVQIKYLALMISLASGFVLLTASGNTWVLERMVKYIPDFKLRTVLSTLMLFGPASVLFGMILPYTLKLIMDNLRTTGETVGNLYMFSTLGSILGTLLAGFLLVPAYGFANTLFSLALFLMLFATILFLRESVFKLLSFPVILILLTSFFWYQNRHKTLSYIDKDTRYNRVLIYDSEDAASGRPIKVLRVNDENSSAMFTDTDDGLVFEVLRYYRLVEYFVPGFKSTLMIGGSGYAFPKDYLSRYPLASIDVVEIDPGLTVIAQEYFNLESNERLQIYHEDGRTFLNKNRRVYDAVFMDAYKSMLTIPYQLTTQEAVVKIYESLSDHGAVFANVISSLDHQTNDFLRAEIATYQSVFPRVLLLAVQYPNANESEKKRFQNLMLIGLKSPLATPVNNSIDEQLKEYLSRNVDLESIGKGEVLTDEYAPVEYFASKVLNKNR